MENNTLYAKIFETSKFSRSKVDIIIPYYGEYQSVINLVNSIITKTRSNPYKITLVDNCSPNKEFHLKLKNKPQCTSLRMNEPQGYGHACKFGFENTKNPWIIFIDSDCEINSANWMVEMGRTMINQKDKNVKFVSSKFDKSDSLEQIPELNTKHPSHDDYVVPDNKILPLHCFMVHREFFDKIGGFMPLNQYGGGEDSYIKGQMIKNSYKQCVSGKSFISHIGGKTFNNLFDSTKKSKEIVDKNKETYKS